MKCPLHGEVGKQSMNPGLFTYWICPVGQSPKGSPGHTYGPRSTKESLKSRGIEEDVPALQV